MRVPKSALLAVVAYGVASSSVKAFPTGARSFVSRATSSSSAFLSKRSSFPSRVAKNLPSVGLHMIFGNLFGGLGNVVEPKIDYTGLDFPGPELGEMAKNKSVTAKSPSKPHLALATFAGGCFWGLELAYQRVPGVEYTAVGYSQGPEEGPTYGQVCSGSTGHTEAVIVYYNPEECSYENLLDTFFERVNPTTVNGQGNDYGSQYRTGVYTHSPEQMEAAKARFELEQTKYKRPIATELKEATPFWPAEKYHQQYLEKGGRFGTPQSAEKGSTETIRCYG